MNEIMPTPRSTVPAGPDQVWQTNPGMALGPVQAAPGPTTVKKVQKLLRGRMALTATLAVLGALAGTTAGFLIPQKTYKSEGVLTVEPLLPTLNAIGPALPFFEKALRTVSLEAISTRTVEAALKRPEWKDKGGDGFSPEAVAGFKAGLKSEVIRDSKMIRVIFEHPDPQLAQAGMQALISAFMELQKDADPTSAREKLRVLGEIRNDLSFKKRGLTSRLKEAAQRAGTYDLSQEYNNKTSELNRQEAVLEKLRFDRMAAEGSIQQKKEQSTDAGSSPPIRRKQPLTPEQIAQYDKAMETMLLRAAATETELERLKVEYGSRHPGLRSKENDLRVQMNRINEYARKLNEQGVEVGVGVGKSDDFARLITPDYLAKLREAEMVQEEYVKLLRENRAEIGRNKNEIDQLTNELRIIEDDIKDATARYDRLSAELAVGTGQISVNSYGEVPEVASDKRKQLAVVGFVLGGGLPVGLMLLLGLLDGRYRYSDDSADDTSGLTLLGILPNLPDRLSDPTQASVAAHCVHQIRTMLQLHAAAAEDRKCYAVTSASSGDGKTSLTLALGLSFAASGSKTLLIDCDLIGAGLTGRLNMAGPEGILEAITHRSLMDYVRQTDITDLSILPVGLAGGHHAGMFSPGAMRRLIDEAKKHFEVILIDTGPVLGSIEATPVCASADGVVLAVSRGQQRPLVEKARAHLRSIGATIAGVVFNRAQARDFETSISGISLRSQARSGVNGNGHNSGQPGQYGAIARAVASNVQDPAEGRRGG
jgi:capsular exopolysaccharide synthesis family protein